MSVAPYEPPPDYDDVPEYARATTVEPAATPPNNGDFEQIVLGAAMRNPTVLDELDAMGITAGTFYNPAHTAIYATLRALRAAGDPTDPAAVKNELDARRALSPASVRAIAPDGNYAGYLIDLLERAPATVTAGYYGRALLDLARRRDYLAAGQRLTQRATMPGVDIADLEAIAHDVIDADRPAPSEHQLLNITDFLAQGDEEWDWLVPGFLEHTDRCLLTASEGHGKSTLLRQWAIQIAAGVHPITSEPIEPATAVIVDVENSARQMRRAARPLMRLVPEIDPDRLHLISRADGLNLRDPGDVAWLDRLVADSGAQVLVIGPIYKLADGNPNSEEESKPAALALDRIRVHHGVTLLLEAHSAKAAPGIKRTKEPIGWSGWLRWPELGLHLGEHGEITHWRRPRNGDAITLPDTFTRGGRWPFTPGHVTPYTPDGTDPDQPPKRLSGLMRKISALLEPGEEWSRNDIAKTLTADGSNARRTTILAVVEEMVVDGYLATRDGANRSKPVTIARPYVPRDDPKSDEYEPVWGTGDPVENPGDNPETPVVPGGSQVVPEHQGQVVPDPPLPRRGREPLEGTTQTTKTTPQTPEPPEPPETGACAECKRQTETRTLAVNEGLCTSCRWTTPTEGPDHV